MSEKIYPVNHLSPSSVSAYLMCARAWKFRYIDQIETPTAAALSFGSAFHEAIRLYVERKALKSKPKQITELFKQAWDWRVNNENIDYGDNTPQSLEQLGCKMLSCNDAMETINSLTPKIDNENPVLEKRVEFNVENVSVPIIGYIDMISKDGIPFDFKTSGKSWYGSRADDEIQPYFYLEALRQSGQMPQDGKFRYYIFVKTKTPKVQQVDTFRSVKQLEWIHSVIRDVWNAIVAGAFPPSGIGSWKCSKKYCEYWDICHNDN